jgi:diguanylate cyclase (GGDEF)-like protein
MAQEADGALWIGFSSGDLWRLKAGSRAKRVTKLPHFTAMLVDSRHRLWIPTRAGVFLKLPDEAQPRRLGDEHEYLDAAEDARGGVWIAGSDGLQRFADGAWTPAPIADRRATPGFASVAIGPDGVLWAASRSRGVVRAVLDGARLRDTRWIDDPLVANASPMFVRIDAARRVWVGTDYGVVVQEPGAADAAGVQPPWRRLTESDGLVWNDVNQASFQADADGSVWIGTSGGLTHIVDPTRAIARRPLQLELTHPRFADRPVTLAKGQQWPWSRSAAFDLELVCLNFSRSMDSVFRYRIVGVDVDWFETSNPKVHYPALEPGSYRFEAVIVDPDRRQSSPIVSYEFEVLPPWWRTLWFRASCALLAGLAMLAAWRWQIGRITARHAMEQQLAKERNLLLERASRDALTGLWNRASILDLLAQALQGRRPGEPVAVAIIDVDHFKRVNDEHGHAVGDKVLRDLGHRLSTKLRQCDLLGRYGGEELLLVMPGLPCEAPANAVERLREGVCDQPFEIPGGPLPVTVSIGVAWLGVPGAGEAADLEDTAQALFERADAALYDAKRNGRNRVSYGVQATGGAVDHEMHAPGH